MSVDAETRSFVLDSFDKNDFYYYHTTDRTYSDFIDGMAWVGLLCGAAYRADDLEVAKVAEGCLANMLRVGEDARNFVPRQLNDKYVVSTTMLGYYYRSGQSFAGPAGLTFAVQSGAQLQNPYKKDVEKKAKWLAFIAGPFGYFVKWDWFNLRQHINSMFLAHLILDKRPPNSLEWLGEENPFYSYIMGKKLQVEWPEKMNRTTEGHNVERKEIVPLSKTKPNSWILRRDPFMEYIREGDDMDASYTPAARLVSEYLQSTL